jgi:hypothetical protein
MKRALEPFWDEIVGKIAVRNPQLCTPYYSAGPPWEAQSHCEPASERAIENHLTAVRLYDGFCYI